MAGGLVLRVLGTFGRGCPECEARMSPGRPRLCPPDSLACIRRTVVRPPELTAGALPGRFRFRPITVLQPDRDSLFQVLQHARLTSPCKSTLAAVCPGG